MRNKVLLAVFSLWLYPVANLCEPSPTIAKSLSGKNDYELVFSGAMSFDMPFGANQNQQSFLFSGAGISKLFKNKTATTF
jgi:hypothetical protein